MINVTKEPQLGEEREREASAVTFQKKPRVPSEPTQILSRRALMQAKKKKNQPKDTNFFSRKTNPANVFHLGYVTNPRNIKEEDKEANLKQLQLH